MTARSDPAPLLASQDCGDCPIRTRAVCSRCDGGEIATLEAMKSYRRFAAGQTIVWAGDRMDFVGSVVQGVATLTRNLEDGRTQTVGLLLPSDFVGRPGRDLAPFTVTAISDVLLCCFRRKPFEALMLDTPAVGQRLLEMVLDELDAAREWMLLLGRKTAREKIASLLAIFLRRQAALWTPDRRGAVTGVRPGTSFDLPLSREAMGNYLGLTIETVSRQLTALRRDGVIRIEGTRRIIVLDSLRLRSEAGQDDASAAA
jgi:CRP/FNR family transcriptional regulator, anaerobic regulatory protein